MTGCCLTGFRSRQEHTATGRQLQQNRSTHVPLVAVCSIWSDVYLSTSSNGIFSQYGITLLTLRMSVQRARSCVCVCVCVNWRATNFGADAESHCHLFRTHRDSGDEKRCRFYFSLLQEIKMK